MAKRFTDSEKFSDTWYRKLSPLHKVIWEYLLAECNHAGILANLDLEMASFKIGADITDDDLKSFEDRIIFISNNILFIPKFIEFQYGNFNPKNRVHFNVLKELEKYKISTSWTERGRSVNASKEKEQEQEKEKEKEKEYSVYGKYHNVCMNAEQYNRLLGICASQKLLDELVDNLSENIAEGKEKPYCEEFPDAHFVRIDKYRQFRLKNPNKFHQIETKSKIAETTDKWYEQMKARGYGS